VKKIDVSCSPDPSFCFSCIINEARKNGDHIIFVGYDDEKEFPGHQTLRDAGVPLRFIKKPSYEIKTEKKERTQDKS
jgi:hypothetical protein